MASNDVNPRPESIRIATIITNTTYIPSTLRYICGKRSHGWRSARIETGRLVEGVTDLTQCATRKTLIFLYLKPAVIQLKQSIFMRTHHTISRLFRVDRGTTRRPDPILQ